MHPYISQAIFSIISIIVIYALMYIATSRISNWGSMKLLLTLVITTTIAVIITTAFDSQIENFITVTLWLNNYVLWKTIIEWIIILLLSLLFLRWYFSIQTLWIILIFVFYFVTVYWITPLLYRFYDFMVYLIDRFL